MGPSTILILVLAPWAVGGLLAAAAGRRQRWLPVLLTWIALAWSIALIALSADLVVGFGDVARSLVPERKVAARAVMAGSHWILVAPVLFTWVCASSVWWGVRRRRDSAEDDSEESWTATTLVILLCLAPVGLALVLVGSFYLGFMGLDPAAVDSGSAFRASMVLLGSTVLGWFACVSSLGFGGLRVFRFWRRAEVR